VAGKNVPATAPCGLGGGCVIRKGVCDAFVCAGKWRLVAPKQSQRSITASGTGENLIGKGQLHVWFDTSFGAAVRQHLRLRRTLKLFVAFRYWRSPVWSVRAGTE